MSAAIKLVEGAGGLESVQEELTNSPLHQYEGPAPPPPPPDPPFGFKKLGPSIRVGDVDVRLRQKMEKQKRRATRSGVTEEARTILEQFLKHSLSGRRSPGQYDFSLSEREYMDECPYMLLQSNESYYESSYYGNAGMAGKESSSMLREALFFDEPDYAEPAEPDEEEEEEFEQIPETQEDIDAALGHHHASKTNSVSSQSSFAMSFRGIPATYTHSPSDKLFLSVHPPNVKAIKIKGKSKKHTGLLDESSSSTEDYEYTENYLTSRKKKSFFKWASERLRQSFRRSNKVPPTLEDTLESPKHSVPSSLMGPIPPIIDFCSPAKAKKKAKKSKLKFNLKRHGSEKGSKSSSTPNDTEIQAHLEALQIHSEGEAFALRTDDTEASEKASEKTSTPRKKSPVPWKRYEIKPRKEKSVPPVDGPPKDKGIFDSFLKHIRKGSSKLKRKGPKDDDSVRQRSRSADNLALQPLSKEHEKLLQRYTSARRKEEYDSEGMTVHSFHEVMTHRVTQQGVPSLPKPSVVWYPPPLPPEPPHSDDGLTHDSQPPVKHQTHLDDLHTHLLVPGSEQEYELDLECERAELEVRERTFLRIRTGDSGEDEIDGGPPVPLRRPRPRPMIAVPQLNIVDKPFHERTDVEKDELYEKIAEQLAAIADHYNFESPRSSKSMSSPTSHSHSKTGLYSRSHSRSHSHSAPSHSEAEEGAIGVTPSVEDICPISRCSVQCSVGRHELEKELGALLRGEDFDPEKPDVPPMMAELVRNASYSKFKQIVNQNIGTEPGWQQIAMMFRLTQTAVQLAGFGTAVALQIKEMTLKYFEDKFAGWIVGQGGWESVVEDTNTENDSELD